MARRKDSQRRRRRKTSNSTARRRHARRPNRRRPVDRVVAAIQAGRVAEAADILERAIARGDRRPETLSRLGEVYLWLGRPGQALPHLEQAGKAQRQSGKIAAALGRALFGVGRAGDAIEELRRALELDASLSEAWLALVEACVQSGRATEAADLVDELASRGPANPREAYALAEALRRTGRTNKAEQHYRALLKEAPTPKAWNNLATICLRSGRPCEALALRRKAAEAEPNNPDFARVLAGTLLGAGRIQDAIDLLRRWRARAPTHAGVHSDLLLALHYPENVDREELFEEHRRWGAAHAPPAPSRPPCEPRDPNRCLRIGYISPDFRRHPVASFFEPLLDAHDRDAFEIYGYGSVTFPDDVTRRLAAKFDTYRAISGASDEAVVRRIAGDRIDILVDLVGHTSGHRLGVLAHGAAPVQVTYLGYPDTTGIPAIDYRLTDERADPPGAEARHTESLMRLPRGFLCFSAPSDGPDVSDLPQHRNGYVTFASFNNNAKITPEVLSLWAHILHAVDGARLLLKFRGGGEPELARHYRDMLSEAGVDCDRVDIIGTVASYADHLRLYHRADIALDTFPYHGTTTTCEALWMGVPVVTLIGDRHVSRVGLSILSSVGLERFAAADAEQYVATAVATAGDVDALATLRSSLRDRMAGSPLCDRDGFARDLEAAYRDIWQRTCRRQDEHVTEPADTSTCSPASAPQTKPVRLLHNLARSGGTLVSRCLACLPDTVLLSEIHPLGVRMFHPIAQADQWYGLFTPEELAAMKRRGSISFPEAIALIADKCTPGGRHLVLRDWSHLDYMGVPFVDRPSGRMGLAEALAPRFELRRAALVRHPVDQWLSLRKLTLIHGTLDVAAYLDGCAAFAEQARRVGFVRYEDFTRDPTGTMRRLCDMLDLPYDDGFLDRWCDYTNVTGDTRSTSRGDPMRTIKPLPPREAPPDLLARFRRHPAYERTLALLGYEDRPRA
ncbi:MAG: tetratricopeptide repeat protein [Phycisphaerae bacterium]|nr:tetratricopeptide repeat protein [Phycisphaerae bacterium]